MKARLIFLICLLFAAACKREQLLPQIPEKKAEFQKQVYRAIDDKRVVTIQTTDELELTEDGTNYVCKYTRENDTLRVTLNMRGTTQAIYFHITAEGLKDAEGNILFEPIQYEAVMKPINAQRSQAWVNHLLLDHAKGGNVKGISAVLKMSAQIDAREDRNELGKTPGMTPLLIAVEGVKLEAVRALLDNKADPNAAMSDGSTPLMYAADAGGKHGFGQLPRSPDYDKIMQLLIDHGANINAQNKEGYTALMATLFRQNTEATKLLVRAGADKKIRDRSGKTAIDYGLTVDSH